METLQQIGLRNKTDKAITHLYMDNYEKYLWGVRKESVCLLEIGVAGGGSIKTWKDYFDDALVFGIDNNPDCAGEDIFIGDQTDTKFLDDVLSKIPIPDIIIDDGSHVGELTIKTFEYLFPRMAPGGLYFVEDTATFYSKHYSGEFESNGRSKVFNFFTDLAYHVDIAGRGSTGNVEYALNVQNPTFDPVPKYSPILDSIHIHPSLWVFKRR